MILLTDDAIGMYEKYAGFWKAAVGKLTFWRGTG
jgi:hypothetical protein